MQMAHQDEDALLVSLDAGVFLVLVGARQCLVYRSHGDAKVRLLLLLRLVLGRALEKSWRIDSAERFSVIDARARLRPTDMGRGFRHHRAGRARPMRECRTQRSCPV